MSMGFGAATGFVSSRFAAVDWGVVCWLVVGKCSSLFVTHKCLSVPLSSPTHPHNHTIHSPSLPLSPVVAAPQPLVRGITGVSILPGPLLAAAWITYDK